MWHEARKREKATQKLFSDQKKRAEKWRAQNQAESNSIQVNGLKAELFIDPMISKQAERSLVQWQADTSVTIDRFDVRATLTSIPTETDLSIGKSESGSLKRILNYERYRTLIADEIDRVPENLRLKLVDSDDASSDAMMRKLQRNRFGTSGEVDGVSKGTSYCKLIQSRQEKGVAIGYNYSSNAQASTVKQEDEETSPDQTPDIDCGQLNSKDLSQIDVETVEYAARKYGLSGPEYKYLSESNEVSNILKKFSEFYKQAQLKAKNESLIRNKHQTDIEQNQDNDQDQDYGPCLPPELSDIPCPSSSPPPDMLPEDSHSGSQDSKDDHVHSDKISCPELQVEDPKRVIPVQCTTIIQRLQMVDNLNQMNVDEIVPRSRRAATPLAYKRNRRSSRSLSRDRRESRKRTSSSRSSHSSSYSTNSSHSSHSSSRSRSRSRSRHRYRSRSRGRSNAKSSKNDKDNSRSSRHSGRRA